MDPASIIEQLRDAVGSFDESDGLVKIDATLIRSCIAAFDKSQADLHEAQELMSMKPTLAKKLNDRIKALTLEVEVLRGDTKVDELERKVQRLEGELKQSYATKNFTLRSGLMEIEKVYRDWIDSKEEVNELWGEIMLLLAEDNKQAPASSSSSSDMMNETNPTVPSTGGSGGSGGGAPPPPPPPPSALKTTSTVASRRMARQALASSITNTNTHLSPFLPPSQDESDEKAAHQDSSIDHPSALTPLNTVQGKVGRLEEEGWMAIPPSLPPSALPPMRSLTTTLSPPDASYRHPLPPDPQDLTSINWAAVDDLRTTYEPSLNSEYSHHPSSINTSQAQTINISSPAAAPTDRSRSALPPTSPAPRYMIPDASAMDLSSSNEVMRACVSSLKLLFSSSSSHNQPSISHQAGLTIAPQRGPDASYLDKQVDELGQSVDTLISTFALLLSPHQAAQANRRSSSSYTYTSSHPAPLDASSFVAQAEQVLGSIRQLRDLYDQQQLLTEDPFPSFKPLSSSSDESSTTNIASINRVEEFEVHAEALTSSVLNALRSVSLLSQKKDMQLTLSPSPSPSKAITSSLSPPINNPQHPPPLPLLPTNSHPGAVLALFTAFLTKQNKDGNINSSGQSFDSNLSDANGSSVIELFHQFLKSPEAAAMVASGGAVRGVSLGGGGGGRGMDSSVTGEAGFPLPAADITSRQAVKALYSEPNDEHQRSKRPLKVELQLIDEEANDAESSGQHTAAPDREERVRIKLSLEAVHSGESLLPEKESGSSSSWDWHQAGAHFSSAATKMTAVAHHQPKDSNDTRSDQELMLMDLQRANYDLAFRMAELDHTIASLREENDHVTRMLVDLKVETAEKDNECMRLQQRLKKALRFENQIRDERENEDLQRQRDIYHKSLGPAAGVVVKNESKGAQGGGLLSSSSSLGGGNGQEQGLQTPSRPLLGVGRKR